MVAPPLVVDPLYFGCRRRLGHFVWSTRREMRFREPAAHWLCQRDGKLPPDLEHQEQGVASLRQFPETRVTVLALWDRSVDQRRGSNSVFLLPGILDFGQAVERAQEAFPDVWGRFTFDVVRHHFIEPLTPAPLPEDP